MAFARQSQTLGHNGQTASARSKLRFPWEEAFRESGIDITLMVPSYNEVEDVAAALEDIRNAVGRLKITYEVIVNDDCSSDRTSDKVREYQLQHPEVPIYRHCNASTLLQSSTRECRLKSL